MISNAYLILHLCTNLFSIASFFISLVLYILLKERWRLFLSLFIVAGILFISCDSIGIIFKNIIGNSTIFSVFLVLFFITGISFLLLLIQLYKFGMQFVLKRWEKKYLFLFAVPVVNLLTLVSLYFSIEILPLFLIILIYATVSGVVIYILSIKNSQKKNPDNHIKSSERELVFFLLMTVLLIPLEILEYIYKTIQIGIIIFPIGLLVTPIFLIVVSLFLIVTGFRTFKTLSYRKKQEFQMNLTEREKEVASLLIEGFTHKEIAIKLFISHRTIDRHVENIYQKYGTKNKTEFIRLVIIPNS